MTLDEIYMQRAIDLAKIAGVAAAPNPLVGAVIVHNDEIIGEGFHQKYGEAHAEVNAIASVKDKKLLKDSTIYVTLEPCAHHGKTGPCAELLVKHQFKRVVIGCVDPFPKVAGHGIQLLKNVNIPVKVGCLEASCLALNKRFFSVHTKKRPYVFLKWAQTPKGLMDNADKLNREVSWISQPETQTIVHLQRSQEQAILVGWKTIQQDNPSLTVRAVAGTNPLRCVIDPNLQAPKNSTIFTDGLPTLVFNYQLNTIVDQTTFVKCEQLDPATILQQLTDRSINSIIIEGGSYTLQAFIDANLWDEAMVIVGDNEFENGTKAPILEAIPYEVKTISNDKLFFFRQ